MVEMLPEDLPVTVLPQQAVGKSNEHLRFPGTLTLSAETLTQSAGGIASLVPVRHSTPIAIL
jgi:creatinine amidohydrolase/Fe(II)-dependent formamide hydrolase-like protein